MMHGAVMKVISESIPVIFTWSFPVEISIGSRFLPPISWLGGPERRRGHPSPAARDQVRYSTAGHHRTGRDSENHREAKDSEKVMYKSLIEGRERVELENFD